jgi:hypothetical protein
LYVRFRRRTSRRPPAWYEEQQSGLGLRLVDAVDQVLTRFRTTPLQFPAISAAVHRALLHTFPYATCFRLTEKSVVILAVLHLRRDPRNGARARSYHAGKWWRCAPT